MSKPQTEAKQAQPTKSAEELFSDTNVTMKTGRLVSPPSISGKAHYRRAPPNPPNKFNT